MSLSIPEGIPLEKDYRALLLSELFRTTARPRYCLAR